ncbi:hypothetical protein V2J09_009097 [Rumex salicifolius]
MQNLYSDLRTLICEGSHLLLTFCPLLLCVEGLKKREVSKGGVEALLNLKEFEFVHRFGKGRLSIMVLMQCLILFFTSHVSHSKRSYNKEAYNRPTTVSYPHCVEVTI